MQGRVPLIISVNRNCLDDGPGIRSSVFFKGCPLRCAWCQNPEAQETGARLQLDASLCMGCGRCAEVCPLHCGKPASDPVPRSSLCRFCGCCVDPCPTGARSVVGRTMTAEELVDDLAKDAAFYRHSGGGVTLTGGEPTLFPEFAGEVAERLSRLHIPVLLETCGYFDWEKVERSLLPHLAGVFFSLSLADPRLHAEHTGRSNELIMENLGRLARRGAPTCTPRITLIPGITDTEENLRAVAGLVKDACLAHAVLLPYNPLWLSKCAALGLQPRYRNAAFMGDEELSRCRSTLQSAGIAVG
jgi:pyruvate formate lyase activating enzyme